MIRNENELLFESVRKISEMVRFESKEQLLNEIAAVCLKVLNGYACILWEFAKDQKQLKFVGYSGEVDKEYCEKIRIGYPKKIMQKFLEKKIPLSLESILDAECYTDKEEAHKRNWVSLLSAPMISRNHVIGIIDLYTNEKRHFDQWEKGALSILAVQASQLIDRSKQDSTSLSSYVNHTATVLDNNQLLEKTNTRGQKLKKLVEIGEAVTHKSSSGLKPVLEQAAESACEFTGSDYAAIYPYDTERELFYDLENVVICGLTRRPIKEKPREEGLAAMVRNLGELIVSNVDKGRLIYPNSESNKKPVIDKQTIPDFIRKAKFINKEGVKAFVGLSLKAGKPDGEGEEEVGVLYIDFCHPHHFTDEELDLIRIFGHQVGCAMQAARLLHREKQKLLLIEALQKTLSFISSQHDPQKVAESIADSASKLMSGKKGNKFEGAIWICDHESQKIKVEYSFDYRLKDITLNYGEGLAGWVAANEQPLYVNDYLAWSNHAKVFEKETLRDLFKSLIEVPLFWSNRVIGVLAISCKEEVNFSDEDLELLERFAESVAIVLQNTRLYEALRSGASTLLSIRKEDPEALETIAYNAVRQLDADNVIIFEYYKGRDDEFPKRPPISKGIVNDPSLLDIKIHSESVVAKSVLLKEPKFLENTQQDEFILGKWGHKAPSFGGQPERDRFVFIENIKSSAIVPLKVDSETVGILFVNYRRSKEFPSILRAEIELFASQAALAIRTSRTFEQMAALHEIQNAITEVRDLDEVLNLILGRALTLVGFSKGWISLFNPQTGFLEIEASHGNVDELNKWPLRKSGEGVTGHVFKTGKPLIISDVNKEPDMYEAFFIDTKSELCVPMRFHEETIGVMNVESHRLNAFSNEDKKILTALSDTAAIAIKNVEFMSMNKEKAKKLEMLASGSREMMSNLGSLSFQDRLNLILKHATDILYAESGSILLVKEAGYVQVEAVYNYLDDSLIGEKYQIRSGPKLGLTGYIAYEGKVFSAHGQGLQNHWAGAGTDARTPVGKCCSLLVIPLKRRVDNDERLIGLLRMDNKKDKNGFPNESQPFTEEDKSILSIFGETVAICLENADLFNKTSDKLESKLKSLTAIQESASAITAEIELDKLLSLLTNKAAKVFGAPAASLMLCDDENKNLIVKSQYGLSDSYYNQCIPRERIDDIFTKIGGSRSFFTPNLRSISYGNPDLINDNNLCSALSTPLETSGSLLGILNIYSKHEPRSFTFDEIEVADVFARQTAVAIHNAQLYSEVQRRYSISQTLYDAGKDISSSLDLETILNRLLPQAKKLTTKFGKKPYLQDIRMVNKGQFKFVAAFSEEEKHGYRKYEQPTDMKRGITGRAARTGISQLVGDVREDDDFYRLDDTTILSELAVPIIIQNNVIGVINVEHTDLYFFDRDDQEALESLATQAAIAIQNARHYKELKRTKGLVGARTALAWMGMTSSAWKHSVVNKSITLREQTHLLRKDLQNLVSKKDLKRLKKRFDMFDRLFKIIIEKPIIPPLSSEEGAEAVSINELISERAKQILRMEEYDKIELILDLCWNESVTVWVSAEWLRRAFDILIDNSVKAVTDCDRKKITVKSLVMDKVIEIVISDTGVGISEQIQKKLGIEQIRNNHKDEGLGMGYLMAETILQTYGGEIDVISTSSSGTSVAMKLPIFNRTISINDQERYL